MDVVLVVVFLFYMIEGYAVGFIAGLFDLSSFVISFLVGLKFYGVVGYFLSTTFSIPQGFANALGFFLCAFITELILNILLRRLASGIQKRVLYEEGESSGVKKVNQWLGILPGFLSALILLSFLLTLIVALPFSPFLKETVVSSKIGSSFVSNTQGFENNLHSIFGQAFNDTLNFLTIEPKSNESVSLHFKTTKVSIDEVSEGKMLDMVNKERTKRGLAPLESDTKLTELARLYGKEMLKEGYFSHYTPKGLSPFDRMAANNISYNSAGENLAFAPSVELAMQGLMQSKGHRENILSEKFGHVGIGVIDAGIYGKMFVQEFTD